MSARTYDRLRDETWRARDLVALKQLVADAHVLEDDLGERAVSALRLSGQAVARLALARRIRVRSSWLLRQLHLERPLPSARRRRNKS